MLLPSGQRSLMPGRPMSISSKTNNRQATINRRLKVKGVADLVWKLTWCRPFLMIYLCRKGQVYLVSPSGMGNHRSSTRHGTNIVTVATTNSSFCQEVERLDGWSSLHYIWPFFIMFYPCRPFHDRFQGFTSLNVALSTQTENSIETTCQGKENKDHEQWTFLEAILCQLLSPKHVLSS